jgi:orotate phosphoribosyltransferase
MAFDAEDPLTGRSGHFLLESGHHGSLWLDLELLCAKPQRAAALAESLARAIEPQRVDAVCGPLVEGAFLALLAASALNLPFAYAVPRAKRDHAGLFPVEYVIPAPLRGLMRGRRVAIVTDVINAGSAVRGTLRGLADCGARPVSLTAALTLGDAAARLAADHGLALHALQARANELWTPRDCPLCLRGVPLREPSAAAEHE